MVSRNATLIKYLFTFLCIFCNLSINDAVETTVPWYENLPAVAMDYKVHIDPGKEDCYFQYVNPGATFYVSFQVSMIFKVMLQFVLIKHLLRF